MAPVARVRTRRGQSEWAWNRITTDERLSIRKVPAPVEVVNSVPGDVPLSRGFAFNPFNPPKHLPALQCIGVSTLGDARSLLGLTSKIPP